MNFPNSERLYHFSIEAEWIGLFRQIKAIWLAALHYLGLALFVSPKADRAIFLQGRTQRIKSTLLNFPILILPVPIQPSP